MGGDRLRPTWDFTKLDATERRFRALLEDEETAAGRAEVLTQLARVEGLRGNFASSDALLDEAESLAGGTPVVDARIALERGRTRRSSGEVEASRPLFATAYERARNEREWFIAADAAHMAAIAAPDRDGSISWTARGVELAEEHEGARYWIGSLLNNLGWAHHDAGDYEPALDAFRRALEAREEAGDPITTHVARHAVGVTLRALGRPAEAAVQLEQAVAWAENQEEASLRFQSDLVDVRGMFHEELAEDYAALGRDADARRQAELALALFAPDDTERVARLRSLAGTP